MFGDRIKIYNREIDLFRDVEKDFPSKRERMSYLALPIILSRRLAFSLIIEEDHRFSSYIFLSKEANTEVYIHELLHVFVATKLFFLPDRLFNFLQDLIDWKIR